MNIFKLATFVFVSTLLAILFSVVANNYTRVVDSALANNSPTAPQGASNLAPSLPTPSRNYLPIILLNAPGAINCITLSYGLKDQGTHCADLTIELDFLAAGGINGSSNNPARSNHTHYGQSWSGSVAMGLSIETTANTSESAAIYAKQNGGSGISIAPYRAGVWGDSQSNSSNAGVLGTSDSVGVAGITVSGTGMYGQATSGVGVSGYSSSGWAMQSSGDVSQSRNNGGWAKAMALVSGTSITRCFNSQSYANKTIAPCGFTSTQNNSQPGDYTIDFGFQVNDRFIAITPNWGSGSAVIPVVSFPSANQVRVQTYSSGTTFVDSAFFVLVY